MVNSRSPRFFAPPPFSVRMLNDEWWSKEKDLFLSRTSEHYKQVRICDRQRQNKNNKMVFICAVGLEKLPPSEEIVVGSFEHRRVFIVPTVHFRIVEFTDSYETRSGGLPVEIGQSLLSHMKDITYTLHEILNLVIAFFHGVQPLVVPEKAQHRMHIVSRGRSVVSSNIVQLCPLQVSIVVRIVSVQPMQLFGQVFHSGEIVDMDVRVRHSYPSVLLTFRSHHDRNSFTRDTLIPILFGDIRIAFGIFKWEIETIIT